MRILIADDESIIRLGVRSMLQKLGHEVIATGSGQEAIAEARRLRLDMAILDIKMPGTDGLSAAKAIYKQQPLPIIFLTAFSDQDLIDEATELPVMGYLVKPVLEGDLAAAIAMANKRFAQEIALQAEADKLRDRLTERQLIERAKGKLMEKGISEEDAYRQIQQVARDKQVTMVQVAQVILRQ
ncbi:MAG: response regulator [Anaerolineales bacterium]|nr:response regulator [Anaerolineales bacterium]